MSEMHMYKGVVQCRINKVTRKDKTDQMIRSRKRKSTHAQIEFPALGRPNTCVVTFTSVPSKLVKKTPFIRPTAAPSECPVTRTLLALYVCNPFVTCSFTSSTVRRKVFWNPE